MPQSAGLTIERLYAPLSFTSLHAMLKVLITDNHAIIRRGIRQILLEEFSFVQMEEITTSEECLTRIKSEHWDIVMVDLSVDQMTEAVKEILKDNPQCPILVLSSRLEGAAAAKAIQLGVCGYLTKDSEAAELIRAVRQILAGKKYLPESIANIPDAGQLAHEKLSERELDVFKLLAAGKTVAEIGKILALESNTISTYRSRLLSKMNMRTNADILRYAMEHGLI